MAESQQTRGWRSWRRMESCEPDGRVTVSTLMEEEADGMVAGWMGGGSEDWQWLAVE